jgi:hypothetical protein
LIEGASDEQSIRPGDPSAVSIAALAQLMLARSEAGTGISLSSSSDIKDLVQSTISSANAAGMTRDLRATSDADLQILGDVIAGYTALVNATTNAGAQSTDAISTLRAGADLLLPTLNRVGYEASSDRGGDISLTVQSRAIAQGVGADVQAYIGQQINAANLASSVNGFETSPAIGTAGRLIRLSIQMPSLGLSDTLDQFTLSAVPAGVDLLRVNPLTGATQILAADAQGVYTVAAEDAGYLAVRGYQAIDSTFVTLGGSNAVDGVTSTYQGQIELSIRAAARKTQAEIVQANDGVGPLKGRVQQEGRTDDPAWRLACLDGG